MPRRNNRGLSRTFQQPNMSTTDHLYRFAYNDLLLATAGSGGELIWTQADFNLPGDQPLRANSFRVTVSVGTTSAPVLVQALYFGDGSGEATARTVMVSNGNQRVFNILVPESVDFDVETNPSTANLVKVHLQNTSSSVGAAASVFVEGFFTALPRYQ